MDSRILHPFLIIALALSAGASRTESTQESVHKENADVSKSQRVFEQRVYTTAEGKLSNLNARFRDHTNYLFVKHGMSLVGYWTPVDQPNTLVYILAYPNKVAREKSWENFMADPVWQKVWAQSKEEAGGPIVVKVESTFMNATDYSPIQ